MTLNQQYAGAICMGNSFGYFNFDKMNVFIKKVSSNLETGAKFIINSDMIAESVIPNFQNHQNKTYTVDNIAMNVTNVYHVEDSYMSSHLLFTKDGKSEEHSFKHFVFTLGGVKRLLNLYGFKTIATYGSLSKKEYVLGDQQIYIIAEKYE